MKGDIFNMIFLRSLNTCESSEYFKMIFEEIGFITAVYGSLFTLVHQLRESGKAISQALRA